jgi:hypothetical protein
VLTAVAVVATARPATAQTDAPIELPSEGELPTPEQQEEAWESLSQPQQQVAMDIAEDEILPEALEEIASEATAGTAAESTGETAGTDVAADLSAAGAAADRHDIGDIGQGLVNVELRANRVLGFGSEQDDRDGDALPDAFEDTLAQLFMPEYHVSAGEEPDVGFTRFLDQPDLEATGPVQHRPPIVHTRVTGVGGRWSGGTLYGYIRADFLTLWNRDNGYVNGPAFPCSVTLGLAPGHPNDPERSALLLAAPVVNDGGALRYNPDPNAYRANYQFTTAHEDFAEPAVDEDRFLEISPPSAPGDHASLRLFLSKSKHGTYPFDPDGHPVLVPAVRIAARAVFLAFSAAGRLADLIDRALGRIGLPNPDWLEQVIEVAIVFVFEIVIEVCAAEEFDEDGPDVPAAGLNVGEPNRPMPGFAFIADPDVNSKLVGAPTGRAPRGTRTCGYTWTAGKSFAVDEHYVGCRGWLIMQSDGNLVLYDEYDVPLWATGTVGYPGATAAFQGDGNLVVYWYGYPVWASNTAGRAVGGRLVLTDDANLVIDDSSGWPVWDRRQGSLPPPPTPYTLTSINSGRCLDVNGFSQANGGIVQQWDCHGGINQQWRLTAVGPRIYTLTSINSGRCLDVDGFSQANGGIVQQWDCHGGTNQRWTATPAGGAGRFTLTSVNSGKCLEIAGSSLDNGAQAQQWDCTGAANQIWQIVSLAGVPLPGPPPSSPPRPPRDPCISICL